MESSSLAYASERATKMWTRACKQPVTRRFSCLATNAPKPASGAFLMQMRGVGLKNGVPYLQKWDYRHLPGMSVDGQKSREQVLTSRYPAGFIVCLAAIALPFFTCKTQISPSVCINGLPYHKMESSDIACTPERGAKMWTRACNLPVHRRFYCLTTKRNQACFRGFFQCKWEGWA